MWGKKLDMKHTDTSSHVLALVLPALNTATLALHDGESAAQTEKKKEKENVLNFTTDIHNPCRISID